MKKSRPFDEWKKLQSFDQWSDVCAVFYKFALEALNSNSWIGVCVCIFGGQQLFFFSLPQTFVYIRFPSPIIFCCIALLDSICVCLSTCSCCHARYLSNFLLHCYKSFKSILCNFITYSAFVLHFTNIYYGNIYAIQKPKIKFQRRCWLNRCQYIWRLHLIKWEKSCQMRKHTLHKRATYELFKIEKKRTEQRQTEGKKKKL